MQREYQTSGGDWVASSGKKKLPERKKRQLDKWLQEHKKYFLKNVPLVKPTDNRVEIRL